MSIKVAILLALTTAYVKATETNDLCPCESSDMAKDNLRLLELIGKYSKNSENPALSEEERNLFAVNPAILSPMFNCDCLENARKKRKIFPETEEYGTEQPEQPDLPEQPEADITTLIHYNDSRCPNDHVRIGVLCIKAEFLE